MPALFVGHGSPMNVIEDNRWSRGFARLPSLLPKPVAIVAVSAHWFGPGSFVTANRNPETIHDFSGFPPALYEISYPASGAPELAERVSSLLGRDRVSLSSDWGLDHGTWSVLRWMYPEADVSVVQLSIDSRLSVNQHHELAGNLASLRDDRILLLGSGNVVHNLRDAFHRKESGTDETPAWANRFDETVSDALAHHDTETLLALWPDGDDGRRAHPSPDHWLPLLYVYAATDASETVTFPIEGFDWGSLSMRSVLFGSKGMTL
jgi:4,5-DOPA dioxygenase extradiol